MSQPSAKSLSLRVAQLLWASPCSAIGLALAAVALIAGGRATCSGGTLEVSYRPRRADCGALARRLPFRAIVFGHIILAVTREELLLVAPHERVHVQQYQRWGPLFLLAYPASSLWQVLRGRRAYLDNHFEIQARQLASEPRSLRPAQSNSAL